MNKTNTPIALRASIVQTGRGSNLPANLASEEARTPKTAMPKNAAAPFVLAEALLSAFDTNDRINQYLLDNLPAEAWRAELPGKKGRDVAAVVAHMHNVRVMWLKATIGKLKVPEQLDRFKVTPAQAKKALESSRAALREVLSRPSTAMAASKAFAPISPDFSAA